MKAVQFKAFGTPTDVAECVDLPDPGKPGADQALLAVEASPINPSDVMTLWGLYGRLPELPAVPGNEGIGRVVEVGANVKHLKAGDLVLLPVGVGTWREQILATAARLMPMPPGVDPLQLSMLTINPPTALLLLREVIELKAGDWVAQNAANSAVGTFLIKLAKARGIHTVNIVRRDSLVAPLKALGADAVVVDGPNLHKSIAAATGGAPVRLGIDAVGGEATMRLAHSVALGGTVVNYGAMSGEPCMAGQHDLIFRDVTLRGFWLASWFAKSKPAEQLEVFGQLIGMIADGSVKVAIEATYPLARIKEALAHAMKPGRDGKILLVPNAK